MTTDGFAYQFLQVDIKVKSALPSSPATITQGRALPNEVRVLRLDELDQKDILLSEGGSYIAAEAE